MFRILLNIASYSYISFTVPKENCLWIGYLLQIFKGTALYRAMHKAHTLTKFLTRSLSLTTLKIRKILKKSKISTLSQTLYLSKNIILRLLYGLILKFKKSK